LDSDVHLWRARLDSPPIPVRELWRSLDESEVKRAAGPGSEAPGARFTTARRFLRFVLGRYLKIEPKEIRFNYGPDGKPELEKNLYSVPLEFNLSHSGRWLLCAVALGRRVGTDIEKVRPIRTANISRRFFLPAENEYLQSLPGRQRHEAFFRIWTLKEAYAKARGLDLLRSFNGLEREMSVMPPDMSGPSVFRQPSGGVWTSYCFQAARGYAAAVVSEGRAGHFSHWSICRC
jgi:4'-phosphopantetheinyl transferase